MFLIQVHQYGGVGGIIGSNLENGKVQNCYNIGNISATGVARWVGGIMGYTNGGKLDNSYNIGTLQANGLGPLIGGLIGRNESTSNPVVITNSYCTTETQYTYNDHLEGHSFNQIDKEELKAYDTILGSAFKADNNINDGYPILSWQ